ncbi:hypothetical protein F4776DRAFT_629386 [Hypoxylon sp. NC0597]|nr:hypothetical protein F4776DRAFT_629386 [Hypoxylon sp. NC0597]
MPFTTPPYVLRMLIYSRSLLLALIMFKTLVLTPRRPRLFHGSSFDQKHYFRNVSVQDLLGLSFASIRMAYACVDVHYNHDFMVLDYLAANC